MFDAKASRKWCLGIFCCSFDALAAKMLMPVWCQHLSIKLASSWCPGCIIECWCHSINSRHAQWCQIICHQQLSMIRQVQFLPSLGRLGPRMPSFLESTMKRLALFFSKRFPFIPSNMWYDPTRVNEQLQRCLKRGKSERILSNMECCRRVRTLLNFAKFSMYFWGAPWLSLKHNHAFDPLLPYWRFGTHYVSYPPRRVVIWAT